MICVGILSASEKSVENCSRIISSPSTNVAIFSPSVDVDRHNFLRDVSGLVRLKLYKGSVSVVGRQSSKSLYSESHVTFEADMVYNQRDAQGFINLSALRLKLLQAAQKRFRS